MISHNMFLMALDLNFVMCLFLSVLERILFYLRNCMTCLLVMRPIFVAFTTTIRPTTSTTLIRKGANNNNPMHMLDIRIIGLTMLQEAQQ